MPHVIKMTEEDSEHVYSQFVLSEHQTTNLLRDTSAPTAANSTTREKYTSSIKDNERTRILGGIVRLLLRRAPFPTKYEDIRNIVKAHLHDKINNTVVTCLLDDAKNLTSSIFGLTMCDVRLPGGKREVFLKQSLAFPPHDLKITSEGDHELRGFLILLVPCMKAYVSGIPLDRLCEIFSRVGKGHMVPQDKESEDALISALRTTRKRKDVKYLASDFQNISDYLLYARDLSYIQFQVDANKTDGLGSILIATGYRFVLEFDQASYVNQFNTLKMDSSIKRSLSIFFDN